MRFFTKIILLFVGGLTTSIGAFAQNSIKNVPAGWEVKVGDNTVTVTNGVTAPITAGQTVRIINNSGKDVREIVVAKKGAETSFEGASAIGLASTVKLKSDHDAKLLLKTTGNNESGREEGGKGNVAGILSEINENGEVIKPVAWDFDWDDFIATLPSNQQAFIKGIKDDLVLSLPYIYPIGDKWLWMIKCNLEYAGDFETAPTMAKEQYGLDWETEVLPLMSETVDNYIDTNRRNYLVRVSDGAIFPWINAPEKQRGIRGDYMSPEDLYGVVEPYGNGDSIVYINKDRQIVLLYATIAGLQEKVISPSEGEYTKAMFVAPTKDGHIGTILTNETTMSAQNCHGVGEACVFSLDGTKKTIGAYRRYTENDGTYAKEDEIRDERELCALNGTLYYITRAENSNAAELREVLISEDGVTTSDVKASWANSNPDEYDGYELHNGITGIPWPVFHSKDGKMMWGAGQELNIFNPAATPAYTIVNRPEHYAHGLGDYYNGIAYVLDGYDNSSTGNDPGVIYNNSFPVKAWICDLSKAAAEELNIDWSGLTNEEKDVVSYQDIHWRYWGGEMMFYGTATLTKDNKKVQYVIPVTGENKGKVSILKGGETRITSVITLKK